MTAPCLWLARAIESSWSRLGKRLPLDGKDVGAPFGELLRNNPGTGADIDHTGTTDRQQIGNQLLGVARSVRLVAVRRPSK
jgi:hypothetical protein